eukprot:13518017-Ditylum_brightwellii.AAC.1
MLLCFVMIDPVTSGFEIAKIKVKRIDVVSNAVETTCLTRYPYPTQVVLDRGTKFMAELTDMIASEYGVKKETHHSNKFPSK